MEQSNKPTFGQIAAAAVLAAVSLGAARYCRLEGGSVYQAVGIFLATVGWLAGIGAVLLMLLWAAKNSRT